MTQPLPQLQNLLLDMLSTRRDVLPGAIAALDSSDWEVLLGMVRQHRLGPMLHWRLTRARGDLPIPETVRAELAASFKRATLRALVMQRELLLTHRLLEKAAIPHVALKGAYLAFHAYPHPALRPLRDLDVLVPKEQVLAAYQALVEGGLVRASGYPGDLQAWSEVSKHLPPLRSASGQASVELHNRLFNPDSHDKQSDLADDPQLWQRLIRREMAGESITFLSATDLLLHLIVHAVHDHQFNNGPLVFSDLAFLLETHTIDWPLFWRLAEARGQTRGCLLTLKLMERYFGEQAIVWPVSVQAQSTSLEALMDATSLLTLCDFDARGDVALASAVHHHAGLVGKLGFALKKVFPPRAVVASMYPVPADSPWIYPWYAVYWWRLATKRLPEYLRARQRDQVSADVHRLNRLQQWLQE